LKDKNIEVLLKKVKNGNNEAFEELLELYSPLVISMAEKYSSSYEEIDCDLLRQDARLALYNAAVSFDTSKENISFGLYAKICIRNGIISEIRKFYGAERRARKASERELADISSGVDAEFDREKLFSSIEKNEIGLSAVEKTVVEMMLDGKKIREIACELGKSAKSISNAAFRARVKIKSALLK